MRYCAECAHPIQWHGDRAVVACDGGYHDPRRNNRMHGPWSAPGPVCGCRGWQPMA